MPMNRSARFDDFARLEIGSVEVFDAKMQSGRITASTFWITSALTFGSSNTASTTRSQSLRSS